MLDNEKFNVLVELITSRNEKMNRIFDRMELEYKNYELKMENINLKYKLQKLGDK